MRKNEDLFYFPFGVPVELEDFDDGIVGNWDSPDDQPRDLFSRDASKIKRDDEFIAYFDIAFHMSFVLETPINPFFSFATSPEYSTSLRSAIIAYVSAGVACFARPTRISTGTSGSDLM